MTYDGFKVAYFSAPTLLNVRASHWAQYHSHQSGGGGTKQRRTLSGIKQKKNSLVLIYQGFDFKPLCHFKGKAVPRNTVHLFEKNPQAPALNKVYFYIWKCLIHIH